MKLLHVHPYDSVKTWVQWSRQQNSSRGSRKHCESAHLVSVTGDLRMLTRLSAEIWGAELSVSDLQLEYSFHTFPSYNDYIPRIEYKLSLSFPLFIGIRYKTVHYFLLIILFLFYVQVFLMDWLISYYFSSFGTHSFPFPKSFFVINSLFFSVLSTAHTFKPTSIPHSTLQDQSYGFH